MAMKSPLKPFFARDSWGYVPSSPEAETDVVVPTTAGVEPPGGETTGPDGAVGSTGVVVASGNTAGGAAAGGAACGAASAAGETARHAARQDADRLGEIFMGPKSTS
jgi:hypothetical protein